MTHIEQLVARPCAPVLALFAAALVITSSCAGAAGDPVSTSGTDPLRAREPQRRQHPQQRHDALPLRSRRRHRLPDEPLQHRGRRPVPHRGLRRGGLRRRGVAARARSTPSPPILCAMLSARSGPGSPALLKVDPRRQRGDLDDHAERHRHRAWSLPAAQGRSTSRAAPSSPRHPGAQPGPGHLDFGDAPTRVYGLVFLAVLAGVTFWFVLNQHPLRLRPPRYRPVGVRRGRRVV